MFLRPYLLTLILTSFLLPACGPGAINDAQTQVAEKTVTPTSDELTPLSSASIQINGAGATFPLPIYTDWTYAYSYVDPTVAIIYEGIGSDGGKKAIIEGTVDFAGSGSLLKAEEYEASKDLQMYPVLAGAIVIVYNFKPARAYPADFNVPALILDRQTLVDIFNGMVNQWNDAKIIALNPQLADYLPEASITVVYRSDGSGTTELFTRSLTSFSPDWTAGGASAVEWPVAQAGNGVGGNGNQGVVAAVVNTPNSLGYAELSHALSNSLAYADMINRAGKRVTANTESLASAIDDFGTAAFNDKLTAMIVDGDGEGTWPISGYTYLILHTSSMTDCVRAQKLLEYIHWTLTDSSAGHRAVKLGYAVLPDAVRDQVITKLGEVTCKGQPVME